MKKILSAFMCLMIFVCPVSNAFAADRANIDAVLSDTAGYIYRTVQSPAVGSIGGEWAVIGLARSGESIPSGYYSDYYENVQNYVREKDGMLHRVKYTEYSRVAVALTAIGKDPRNVSGYNLLMPLGDYEKTVFQGINGSVWALIALDSGKYEIPLNPNAGIQATREMYVEHILANQTSAGGWALTGDGVDADITAMAIQALSGYRAEDKVEQAISKALLCMSELQNESGGFASGTVQTSESCAQMLIALCSLGIPLDDARFVKGGNTVLDCLLTYYTKGEGFKHTYDGTGVNLMSTEQALCSLAALKRFSEGKRSLYDMPNAVMIINPIQEAKRAEIARILFSMLVTSDKI